LRKGRRLSADVTADVEKHITACKLLNEKEFAKSASPTRIIEQPPACPLLQRRWLYWYR
jgi:hypothetical protein